MPDLFLGIDAGGTNCRARLVDAAGRLLGTGRAGPANLTSGIARAHRAILAASAEAFAAAGLARSAIKRTHAGIGIAGYDDPVRAHAIEACRFAFASVTLRSDAETACLGAHDGADGGVLILGTGSNGTVCARGRLRRVSGAGFLISDLASGAVLGHAAVRQAMAAHQGIIAPSPLTRRIMRRFDNDASALLAWAVAARPAQWGEFAPAIFAAADKADPVALGLLADATADVGRMLDRMVVLGAKRIALVGGLAEGYARRLPRRFRSILVAPQHDALAGAIMLARKAAAR